jgi:epoxyqueuosine reductase
MSNAQKLQDIALGLGFDAAAWVGAEVPAAEVASFAAWLGAGHHAGMDYLERSVSRRADLNTTFAPTCSVLVLMVSHNHPKPPKPEGGTRVGRVARYAWSRDYHHSLKPVLGELESAAQKLGIRAKATLDHAPILERGLAARAGLGWHGRSSQLISTTLGALTTLAVLLTDLPTKDFPVGAQRASCSQDSTLRAARAAPLHKHHNSLPTPIPQPHPDRCGKCTACISACPTDAILPNRQLDSRRCIAYYTVEHRGSVPLELRSKFGDHLFGCDDCLDICPWTSHSGVFSSLLEPVPELVYPDLESFFLESGNWFEKHYASTAFARARRNGMARNAAMVLGNLKDPKHLWLLEKGLEDVSPQVREACGWAIEQFSS